MIKYFMDELINNVRKCKSKKHSCQMDLDFCIVLTLPAWHLGNQREIFTSSRFILHSSGIISTIMRI